MEAFKTFLAMHVARAHEWAEHAAACKKVLKWATHLKEALNFPAPPEYRSEYHSILRAHVTELKLTVDHKLDRIAKRHHKLAFCEKVFRDDPRVQKMIAETRANFEVYVKDLKKATKVN